MTARGEVFLLALGEDAHRLHPQVLARLRAPAREGRAEGVFEVVGGRFGRLAALARPLTGPRIILTRLAHEVPFTLVTRAGRSDDGRPVLDAVREVRYPRSSQWVSDRVTAGVAPRTVEGTLGTRGRIELLSDCSVDAGGALRMRSRHVALRLGRWRVRLRGMFSLRVTVDDGWDAARGRSTIDMRAVSPLLGTVMEYRGWYSEARVVGGPHRREDRADQ
ncbi:DUF4166 domain-containing protein [Microbacterium sp.]|uniref:DUF4166 domain-containing protein n=1 Tax=Microbacterium sp. TaxID=51671 RepID=UPI002811889D|nr:DUF4166 domain-containing protein [Microbacterium sp.]